MLHFSDNAAIQERLWYYSLHTGDISIKKGRKKKKMSAANIFNN